MSERPRILLVDDEPAVQQALSRAFVLERYDVDVAVDGNMALEALVSERFDAIVLDVTMPGLSGLEVCRRLRASGDRSPVLMLTARDAIDDRVAGLDAGADDYLVKPFALRELMARVRALLRRHSADDEELPGILTFEGVTLDAIAHEVRRGGAGAHACAPSARAARTA